MRAECRFVNVPLMHSYLMVARANVQLVENPSLTQLIKELICRRDREVIWYRGCVQSPIIDAKAERAVLLVNQ